MKHNRLFFAIFFAIALCGISSSAYADEPKGAKGDIKAAPETKVAGAKQTSDAKGVTAQAPRASSPSKQKPQPAKDAKPSPKPIDKVKPTTEASNKRSQTDARFVDRDGDGLRDGKEHRFRGRYRRDSDTGRESPSPQRTLRFRYRYGATGNTPQQGSQGRRGQQ
jgi:hypothetical protein